MDGSGIFVKILFFCEFSLSLFCLGLKIQKILTLKKPWRVDACLKT